MDKNQKTRDKCEDMRDQVDAIRDQLRSMIDKGELTRCHHVPDGISGALGAAWNLLHGLAYEGLVDHDVFGEDK